MRPILIASAIALVLSQPLYAATSSPAPADNHHPVQKVKEPAQAGNARSLATRYSWQALALGREVYRDLLRAQRAAAQHNEIDTRLELHEASRILDSFYEPVAARALRRQIDVIREDMAKEGVKPQAKLWLPLESELQEVLVIAPPEHQAKARKAIEEGRAAAAKGDRGMASKSLGVLENVLDYRWGLLPLDKIRGDVHSAEMALSPRPPYWKGIDESLQSALAAVQWVTTTDATGWFSAYEEAVHARLDLPKHPQYARAALERASRDLDGLRNATALAEKAHELAAQPAPAGKAVESLLAGLRAGITPDSNSIE